MEENLNIFGKNQGEIGSLDKNLVLRTKGRVYIRYGRKYIELLDEKGNLKAPIPKILTKVDKESDMKSNGLYLLDGNLYAYYDGEVYQITGVNTKCVSYDEKQELTQEEINTALKNIGLKFNTLKEAQSAVSEGFVFVGNKIYYLNSGKAEEFPFLNEPLLSINNALLESHPQRGNSVIIWKDGKWLYAPVVTKDEFDKYKKELLEEKNEEKEKALLDEDGEQETDSMFDPILYSTAYTLKSFMFERVSSGNQTWKTSSAAFDTIPSHNISEGDVLILSVNGYWGQYLDDDLIIESNNVVKTIEAPLSRFVNEQEIIDFAKGSDRGSSPMYPDATYTIDTVRNAVIVTRTEQEEVLDIYTFNLKYKDGKLYFLNESGEEISYDIVEATTNNLKYTGLKINDKYLIFKFDDNFKGKHLYLKAEEGKANKFKIDYAHAEIALEENYPNDVESGKTKIIPHTVLGDLDNSSGYYGDLESFRTYTDKENPLGLYSDLAVFNGAEFREPIIISFVDPEEEGEEVPEEPEPSDEEEEGEEELSVEDIPVYNFPRYSKTLDDILCIDHETVEEGDDFEDVMPTIRWIKSFVSLAAQEISEAASAAISGAFPVGIIMMWSGTVDSIPEGWSLCDGGTYDGITTPNLIDKFVKGGEVSGEEGGTNEVTLEVANLPKHSHKIWEHWGANGDNAEDLGHMLSKDGKVYNKDGGTYVSDESYVNGYIYSDEEGEGKSFSVEPAYYTVLFIMKTKETEMESDEEADSEDDEG